MQNSIRRMTEDDLPRLREFWREHWGSEIMIMHGQIVHDAEVEGFVFGPWTGLLTFMIRGNECEVTSINSLQSGAGIGTALMDAVIRESAERKCRRVFLTTTNDNLKALGFYQKRGFELCALRRNAISESRKLKPSIPLLGENNIPLRDEIELEILI